MEEGRITDYNIGRDDEICGVKLLTINSKFESVKESKQAFTTCNTFGNCKQDFQ